MNKKIIISLMGLFLCSCAGETGSLVENQETSLSITENSADDYTSSKEEITNNTEKAFENKISVENVNLNDIAEGKYNVKPESIILKNLQGQNNEHKFEYSENGLLLSYEDILNGKTNEKKVFTYNDNGQIIQIDGFKFNNDTSEKYSIGKYKYDDFGKLIEYFEYDDTGSSYIFHVYEYSGDLLSVDKMYTSFTGELAGSIEYFYENDILSKEINRNQSGIIDAEIEYYSNGMIKSSYFPYNESGIKSFYNERGDLILEQDIVAGIVQSTKEYNSDNGEDKEYSEDGKLIKKYSGKKHDELNLIAEYIYDGDTEYDYEYVNSSYYVIYKIDENGNKVYLSDYEDYIDGSVYEMMYENNNLIDKDDIGPVSESVFESNYSTEDEVDQEYYKEYRYKREVNLTKKIFDKMGNITDMVFYCSYDYDSGKPEKIIVYQKNEYDSLGRVTAFYQYTYPESEDMYTDCVGYVKTLYQYEGDSTSPAYEVIYQDDKEVSSRQARMNRNGNIIYRMEMVNSEDEQNKIMLEEFCYYEDGKKTLNLVETENAVEITDIFYDSCGREILNFVFSRDMMDNVERESPYELRTGYRAGNVSIEIKYCIFEN